MQGQLPLPSLPQAHLPSFMQGQLPLPSLPQAHLPSPPFWHGQSPRATAGSAGAAWSAAFM